jgi:dipeptidyl aminopeptidase/acylaminoacyl peptidase
MGQPGDRPTLSAEDYGRAEKWLRHRVGGLVKNVFVVPHWIGDTDSFWYRRQTDTGVELVLVDAASGRKKPAFDHAAVAAELAPLGLTGRSAHSLPLESMELRHGVLTASFSAGGVRVRCAVEVLDCAREDIPYRPPGVLVSPDGRWGVLTRDGNLWLHDMQSGAEARLSEDGEPHFGYGIYYGNWKASSIPRSRTELPEPPMEAEWSPDSTRVLVPRIDQRHVEDYSWLETAPDDGSYRPKVHTARIPLTGEPPARAEWFVFDVARRSKVRVDLPYETLFAVHQDMLALREVWWSRNGDRLFAVAWGDNLEFATCYEISTVSGEAREMVRESMSPRMDTNSTSYNPPNVRVVGDGEEVIWFSQRDGWGHLYLHDGRTGELKNRITGGEWLVRDLVGIDEARRRIFFTAGGREAGSPYDRYLYRVGFDGSDLVLLSPEPADHMLTSPTNDVLAVDGAIGYQVVSPSGDYVVYNHSRVDRPTRTVLRRVADGRQIAEIEAADASALYEAGWRDPEEVVVKAADGETDLYGLIYPPARLDPEGSYPVIDSQYGSPLTAVVPRNFMMAIQGVPSLVTPASLAELGFAAVVIDARGTTYRSREFSHYSWLNLNTIGLEDHVAAIRQLADDRPWMDIERVGIHGGSYGGWTATRAMFEFPDFFDVGIASVPMGAVHNMYPDYHWTAFHGRVRYADGGALRPAPTDRPVNYENADGTRNAANLEGKLLIMLGELDENVLPATSLQLVDALIELDKDFDMLYVPNRPHNLGSPHTLRRVWDYFVRHLHGSEPPDYRIAPWE